MKLFDWLNGTKRPAAGVPAKRSAEVRADLLAVNRPTAPFIVRDGAPENVDVVAEWRIVDARWYEIFAKAGLTKVFKILIKLDEQASEVRAVDQEWSVEWRAGVPNLTLTAEAFRGQKTEFSFGTAYAFTEKGELADDPEVDLVGIPEKSASGELIEDDVFDVVVSTVESLPRARRRDPDAVAESVRRAVRATINDLWGKKTLCYVHVLMV